MIVNETHYPDETPDEVVRIIEEARLSNRQIRLKFTFTWGSECGYVGRSTGTKKIPLLVHNRRSLGGGMLFAETIVKIQYSNKKAGGVLYPLDNQ